MIAKHCKIRLLSAVVEEQLKSIERETSELLQEKLVKEVVEITNYEYLRYNSHKNIKTIAFCSLFVLAGIYLNRAGGQYLSGLDIQ